MGYWNTSSTYRHESKDKSPIEEAPSRWSGFAEDNRLRIAERENEHTEGEEEGGGGLFEVDEWAC